MSSEGATIPGAAGRLPLASVAVLAVTGAALSAARWHALLWEDYRFNIKMFTTMQARAAELGLPGLDASYTPTPPDLWTSTVYGMSDGLMVAAVVLLGVALVTAGLRVWGIVVPLLLNVPPLVVGWTLTDVVVIPGSVDVAAGPLPWYGNALLIGIAMTLPAALAVRGRSSTSTARIPTRTALRRAGTVAVIVLGGTLLWAWSLQPWWDWSGELAQRGGTAVVIVSTGLLAAALPVMRLRRWAIVAAVLVVLETIVASGVLAPGDGYWFDVSEPLLQVATLAIGPLAVLAAPAAGRAWRSAFRRGPGTRRDAAAGPTPA
ncbi:hypothetical protein ACGIF2_10960 [Cellulomonas sp. P22]|uniref:hypothetical protein n=1 Tax=Cellulomonas sp. P22 TaxID=3373189 RepID=UPI0037AC0096